MMVPMTFTSMLSIGGQHREGTGGFLDCIHHDVSLSCGFMVKAGRKFLAGRHGEKLSSPRSTTSRYLTLRRDKKFIEPLDFHFS